MSYNTWSDIEKQIAQTAFKKAYERETNALINQLAEKIQGVEDIDIIWEIHDYLSAKRHQIDGRYYSIVHDDFTKIHHDHEYATLIFTFAELFREEWLLREDLEGLASDKIAKVMALARL